MNLKRVALPLALAVVALALVATALAATKLSGTYGTMISSGPAAGAWTLTFNKGGYVVGLNNKAVAQGRFTLTPTQITFGHERGPYACPNLGTYRYKLTATALKFTRVSDSSRRCGRAAVLSGRTFTKLR